jgi:hypothetical protein
VDRHSSARAAARAAALVAALALNGPPIQAHEGGCPRLPALDLQGRPPEFAALAQRVLASRQGPRRLRAMGLTPCTDGLAGPYPCSNVDLLSFLPISELTEDPSDRNVETNDIWGWTDPVTGKEYAIIGLTDSASFVDISDPTQPVRVGVLPRHSTADCSIWRSA